MSSINNVRHLRILNFSQKNKKSKMEKKKWPDIGSYTYYWFI